MRLSQLIQAVPTVLRRVGGAVDINGVVSDSREVTPGDLFVAVPGVRVDGHRFIAEAVANGAVAVVGERVPQALANVPWGTFTYIQVPDARQSLGWLCAALYDFPSRKMTLIGVTGTDGKTTTVNLIYAMLRAAGRETGMISTVNAHVGGERIDVGLHTTTPDAPDIQRYLARMVEVGATHAVLEVTSHGLAQHRVAGCAFDVAAITNITHEHLDAHGSLAAYREAKASLFRGLSDAFRKPDTPKVAILNRDDASYDDLSGISVDRQITYSVEGDADVTATDVTFAPDGTYLSLHLPQKSLPIRTALVGAFNISNVLAAASVGLALELPAAAMAEGIGALEGIPGRMERIDEGQDFLAVVDFAHTPNALREALTTAREMIADDRRVIVVFGSAGLRDKQKRSMMGHVAGRLADVVIVTAEDPRTEDLAGIMTASADAAMAEGKREGKDLWRVADRGGALLKACQLAQPGDIVIACGKGHEQSMCFGQTEYPWDDRRAMRLALRGQRLDTLPTAK